MSRLHSPVTIGPFTFSHRVVLAPLTRMRKHAVEGITKSVALEAAPFGIRVNAVAPGPVQTGMLDRITGDQTGLERMIEGVPMKRVGTAEEIARMIVFVASGAVPFMTGEIVRVNGGKTA